MHESGQALHAVDLREPGNDRNGPVVVADAVGKDEPIDSLGLVHEAIGPPLPPGRGRRA